MKRLNWLLGAITLLGGCSTAAEGEFAPEEGSAASRLQALTSTEVFGFENLAHWALSSGSKQALPTATQGSQALGVTGATYKKITSSVIHQLGAVSSELALDLKLPAAAPWGEVQIVLRAPSKGIWYGYLGQKPLSSIASGSFQTLKFQVPANIRAALEAAPNDLTVEIVVNSPNFTSPIALDNLRFEVANSTSVVEIRTPFVDDFAYLEVNGLRHRIGYWGRDPAEAGAWRNVSAWFVGGENQVRLNAINTGGGQGLTFQMRLNGTTIVDIDCAVDGCEQRPKGGVILDQTIQLPLLNLPPARTVRVGSPTPGKLYIDDQFTGLTTPTTLKLPAGEYRLGLGVSSDVPSNLTGSFHEEVVTVGPNDLNVTIGDQPALGTQYTARIAILPMRRARALDSGGLAILTDDSIDRFSRQFAATRDAWLKPLSYGLASWDITLLPTEEEIEMVGTTFDSFPDHACEVLQNPKYSQLLSTYDVVMVHMSNFDEQRGMEIGRGSAGMGGRCGQVQSHWGAGLAPDAPLPVILHEVLHSYEAHQAGVLSLYNGLDGLHGAEAHGFQWLGTQGETEWLEWYRYFMRSQAPERADMLFGAVLPAPVSSPEYYVGTFSSMRHGIWLSN